MQLTLIRRPSLPHSHCTNCCSCLPSTPYTSLSLSALSIGKRFCANCQRYLHRYCPMRLWLPIADWRLHCRLHFKVFDLASSLPIGQPNWPSMSQSQSHTLTCHLCQKLMCNEWSRCCPKRSCISTAIWAANNWCAYWQLQLQLARNVTANEISSKLTS